MIQVDTSQAVKEIRKAYFDLSNEEFNKGVYRAINHTTAKAKTFAARHLTKEYNISYKLSNTHFSTSKAYLNKLNGAVVAQGKPLALDEFKPRQTKEGVLVTIKRGNRVLVRSAFISTMSNGKTTVFGRGKYDAGKFQFRKERTREAGGYKVVNGRWQPVNNDLEINKLSSISIPKAFSMPSTIGPTIDVMEQEFQKRLVHELTRIR